MVPVLYKTFERRRLESSSKPCCKACMTCVSLSPGATGRTGRSHSLSWSLGRSLGYHFAVPFSGSELVRCWCVCSRFYGLRGLFLEDCSEGLRP